MLSLTDKHGITLIPAYIPTHLNVEADYLSQDWLLPDLASSSSGGSGSFFLWGLPEVDLLESPIPLGALGLNVFNHPWPLQVSYVFPSPALIPLVLSQVSGRTCQRSTQTIDSGGTVVDGGSSQYSTYWQMFISSTPF